MCVSHQIRPNIAGLLQQKCNFSISSKKLRQEQPKASKITVFELNQNGKPHLGPNVLPRTTLASVLNLSTNDLRFRTRNHIHIKNNKIVLNLHGNKYVITPDKIYVIDILPDQFHQHVIEFDQLKSHEIPGFFEFKSLEFLLAITTLTQKSKVEMHEKFVKNLISQSQSTNLWEIYPAEDNFWTRIHKFFKFSKFKNLDHNFKEIEHDLTINQLLDEENDKIQERIQKNERLIELLEEITDDDEWMSEFLISKDASNHVARGSKNGNKSTETPHNAHMIHLHDPGQNKIVEHNLLLELEMLFDIYINQLQDLNDKLERLSLSIQGTKHHIQLKQDIFRNKVMLENLNLNRWHIAIMIPALFLAAFGMNMKFGFSESEFEGLWPFYLTLFLTFLCIPVLRRIVAK